MEAYDLTKLLGNGSSGIDGNDKDVDDVEIWSLLTKEVAQVSISIHTNLSDVTGGERF